MYKWITDDIKIIDMNWSFKKTKNKLNNNTDGKIELWTTNGVISKVISDCKF